MRISTLRQYLRSCRTRLSIRARSYIFKAVVRFILRQTSKPLCTGSPEERAFQAGYEKALWLLRNDKHGHYVSGFTANWLEMISYEPEVFAKTTLLYRGYEKSALKKYKIKDNAHG